MFIMILPFKSICWFGRREKEPYPALIPVLQFPCYLYLPFYIKRKGLSGKKINKSLFMFFFSFYPRFQCLQVICSVVKSVKMNGPPLGQKGFSIFAQYLPHWGKPSFYSQSAPKEAADTGEVPYGTGKENR